MPIRPSKTPPVGPAETPAEPPRTLAQEKSDFTAEGSPPPGQVAGVAPVLPVDDALAPPPAKSPKVAANARRQPPSPAGPVKRASKRNPAAWRGNG
jgi:hypothetical protein